MDGGCRSEGPCASEFGISLAGAHHRCHQMPLKLSSLARVLQGCLPLWNVWDRVFVQSSLSVEPQCASAEGIWCASPRITTSTRIPIIVLARVEPELTVMVNCIPAATKDGDIRSALECLVSFGADPAILVDAHPHIGTNKLPEIIQSMREAIVNAGGEVHFGCRMVDVLEETGSVKAIEWLELSTDTTVKRACEALVLATGHSARDVFLSVARKGMAVGSEAVCHWRAR